MAEFNFSAFDSVPGNRNEIMVHILPVNDVTSEHMERVQDSVGQSSVGSAIYHAKCFIEIFHSDRNTNGGKRYCEKCTKHRREESKKSGETKSKRRKTFACNLWRGRKLNFGCKIFDLSDSCISVFRANLILTRN